MGERVSDLSKDELGAMCRAIELWEQLCDALGKVEARPRDERLHIATEVEPGYLGWIGWNEQGCVVYQPATEKDADLEADQ